MKTTPPFYTIVCIVSLLVALITIDTTACTLVKMTVNGKTIVGNNEDFTNPDTRIWFEPGTGRHFGAIYVGYNSLMPEGGINEAGLMFDAFGMPNKPLRDTSGKAPVFELDLKRAIMSECSTVGQVKTLLDKYNLYFWSHSVWVFVDKAGDYLVVDGDSRVLRNNRYFVQTNFRQSELNAEKTITCPRYLKAMALLKNRSEATTEYCTTLMDSVHQQSTLYTTIYDLEAGTIDLYHLHNYVHVVRFSISDELKKGNRILRIPDLFPEVINPAYKGMLNLKAGFDSLAFFFTARDSARRTVLISDLKEHDYMIHVLGNYGYESLREGDVRKAIGIFTLLKEMYPTMPHGYDFLGEAYMQNREYAQALANYERSVAIYPANVNGWQRISVLKGLMEKN